MPTSKQLAVAQKMLGEVGAELHPHQVLGVKWLLDQETDSVKGGLLADDMGVGKTIQIIALMLASPKKINLIVVPANIVNQWKEAIEHFAPSITLIVHWGDSRINNFSYKKIDVSDNTVIITSYGLVNSPQIVDMKVERIICDEAHIFRNNKTKVSRDIALIDSNIRWALTGTPIQNILKDIINLFKYIGYPAANKKNIDTLIDAKCLRRTKDKISIDLPNIERHTIMLKDRSKKSEAFYDKINDGDFTEDCELVRLLRLRQASISSTMAVKSLENSLGVDLSRYYTKNSKLNYIVKDINRKIEDDQKRFLVFTHFKYEIEYMTSKLMESDINHGVISGSVSMFDRNKIIKDESIKVILVQIVSGGTGLNLQSYNSVYFTSPHWNPGMEEQALCRVYRIGQKNRVTITHVICKDTIETRIQDIQQDKQKIIDKYI
jgi:SNF2 family DNA or RNA helicase